MKKFSVLLFSACLLGISFYGVSTDSYYARSLINLENTYMFIRIALVVVLMLYAFVPWVRIFAMKALLSFGGVALLSLGFTSIFSPNLLGYLTAWMLPGETLALMEGGILAIILSGELSARKTQPVAKSLLYIRSLVAARPRIVTYPLSTRRDKTTQNIPTI